MYSPEEDVHVPASGQAYYGWATDAAFFFSNQEFYVAVSRVKKSCRVRVEDAAKFFPEAEVHVPARSVGRRAVGGWEGQSG